MGYCDCLYKTVLQGLSPWEGELVAVGPAGGTGLL